MNVQSKSWREGLVALAVIVGASAVIAWELKLLRLNPMLLTFLWIMLLAIGVVHYAKGLWNAFRDRFVSNIILFGLAVVIAIFARSQLYIGLPLVVAAAQKVNQSATVLIFGLIAAVMAVTRELFILSPDVHQIVSELRLLSAFAVLFLMREPERDSRREDTPAAGRSTSAQF